MNAKVLITVSSLLLLLFSCEKENNDFEYGATYYKSAIDHSYLIYYYTRDGEMTNVIAIKKHYTEDTARFSFFSRYIMEPGYYDTLIIANPEEVIFKNRYSQGNLQAKREGQRLVLFKDSITLYSGGDEFSKSPGYYLLHHKPKIYDEWIYSSTRGDYVFGYHGQSINVIAAEGKGIVLPVIYYQLRRKGKFPNGAYLNNYIQKDFWKNILPGDTLTVLQTKIHYLKK